MNTMKWSKYLCEDCGREIVEIENDDGVIVSECDCAYCVLEDFELEEGVY